ncbi:hypothetical protein MKZ38_007488 [Zalerion maritima]|uniref:Uncharacterized protein n=1 Tax=Zalerion maritima TaxID=339359 RepID=A0AAD5WVX3_9PEZI|nr:hypothetical protein MKZ38_007488 [Zalerion maritima]
MWKQLLFASCVAAQAFNVSVWDNTDGLNVMRVWYGDGIAHAGAVVPSGVSIAFNVSCLQGPPAPLELNPDSSAASESLLGITAPLYLAVNSSGGAEDAIFFVSDLGEVPEGSTALWGAYEGVLFPMDATSSSLPGIAYLGSTEAEGTWVVRWNVAGTPTDVSERLATIMSRDPPGGWERRSLQEVEDGVEKGAEVAGGGGEAAELKGRRDGDGGN